MAIYGGVIGAFLTLFLYCKIKKINPFRLGDLCVPGLILGQAIGRLAATDRIDCCDSCMFCFVVCLFYEERSTVKVNNMPIRKCADE